LQEAKAIPGIGVRLAEKIWEIAESGELQKLKELTSQEETKAIELFTNVWGAGAFTARTWVQRGYRTLDDLKAEDAGLTRNQRIGLKHYDDFLERMSREEAAQIESVVREFHIFTRV
jgi:DNA polymerase lambda